ncbi:Glycoside hydrolase [Macleaya cordata]|uniref:Glycoside hydrolase n=1 Tax=Macleaya cordata TaxID=56857 RepID=A0A200Q6P5_MACCD|nr:Glycoside hydrolase [Macleaya cordata]
MDSTWINIGYLTVAMVIIFHHQLSLTSKFTSLRLPKSLQDNLQKVTILDLMQMEGARHVGVCYGTVGDNLPSPLDVINLYKKNEIEMLRLYEPSPPILEALRGSKILVSLGIKNQDLANLASSQDAANEWVQTNVVPYKEDVSFSWITAGNEVIPGPLSQYVPGAMNNIYNTLVAIGLDRINVTTVLAATALGTSYPPSAGAFSSEVIDVMTQVSTFLHHYGGPLMIDVYPYFAYANNPTNISLDYALFN